MNKNYKEKLKEINPNEELKCLIKLKTELESKLNQVNRWIEEEKKNEKKN